MKFLLLDTVLYTLIVITAVIFLALVVAVFYFVPMGLWITAQFSGVRISILQLIGMRLRRVAPNLIVEELIKAGKAGLKDVKINALEAHYLANGDIKKVIDALISARNAGIELPYDRAAAIDLAGRDVLDAVRESVNTKVIDSPSIEAVAKDGIQLVVKARITVRAKMERLIGGAGQETIIARIGQAIVSSIGSADSHKEIMADPNKISERMSTDNISAGTAYEVVSIDIADIDVGRNIGAELQAEKAEADLKIARAKAEEKRAEAVAEEQHYRAEVQKMRAKLIEAEAQVPMAISDALRNGNLALMDYHRMRNIEADTHMRRAFADVDEQSSAADRYEEERPS